MVKVSSLRLYAMGASMAGCTIVYYIVDEWLRVQPTEPIPRESWEKFERWQRERGKKP